MERATTPSYSLPDPQTTDRGVGGKLRRQPPRRPPPTPYARPKQNQSFRGRFLSILVVRAYSVIARGATRIFPSLFSTPSNDLLLLPEPKLMLVLAGHLIDQRLVLNLLNKEGNGIKSDIKDEGLSEIEKLLEGKTFSREEINCLIEIINSRAVDVSKDDQKRKDLVLSARGANDPIVTCNLRRLTEEKQDDSNKAAWDLETPLPKPIVGWAHNHKLQLLQLLAGWEEEVPEAANLKGIFSHVYKVASSGMRNICIVSRMKLDANQLKLQKRTCNPDTRSKPRIRDDGTSEAQSRGCVYSRSSLKGPFPVGNSNVSKSAFSSIKNNLEQGGTSSSSVFQSVDSNRSSEVNIPPVCSQSSKMARTIFEHLERNLVTPEEKSEELKVATSSKISKSSDADANKSTIETKNVNRISASDLEVDNTVTMFGNNGGSSIALEKLWILRSRLYTSSYVYIKECLTDRLIGQDDSKVTGAPEKLSSPLGINQFWLLFLSASLSEGGCLLPIVALVLLSLFPHLQVRILSLQHHPSCHYYQAAVFISPKRNIQDLRIALAAQADCLLPLFFSFPSTSNVPYHVDASDITFNFGSDRSSRISFSSIGKDTI
ncbi:Dedicator of cytokinesis protein 6, putative isoform 2 [Hibiscus syriacus]|uniref:Dedicator of cytokinesis protein 6, putative isoform 2 n=1 Tax=Hibiscus syriacus TaxID=106335 RepID=A0A6A3BA62_HIBSY|nr:Dedicator of cytokinesis protein 6, putative isoform 2 [Hibiscus syriacus]